jgi:sulfite reductase (NADPH) hemoprotein beta-component
VIGHYADARDPGGHFGDFTIRVGYLPDVVAGREFNA